VVGELRLTNRSLLRKTVLNGKGDDSIDEVFQKGSKFMETATDYIPSSIPRPMAKTGVAIVSGLIVLWLLRTVFEVNTYFSLFFHIFLSRSSQLSSSSQRLAESGISCSNLNAKIQKRSILKKWMIQFPKRRGSWTSIVKS